jgi:hypothetical protein
VIKKLTPFFGPQKNFFSLYIGHACYFLWENMIGILYFSEIVFYSFVFLTFNCFFMFKRAMMAYCRIWFYLLLKRGVSLAKRFLAVFGVLSVDTF